MVGTTEDHVVRLQRQNVLDEMTEHDRKIVGTAAIRLEIPLTDRYTLRKMPGLLRGMAAHIENMARREDLADRSVLLDIKAEASHFNKTVREMHGEDRFNKNGTTRLVDN